MSFTPVLQLCLIHNDPMSTLLVTPDGEAMYSIETPSLHPSSSLPGSRDSRPASSRASSSSAIPSGGSTLEVPTQIQRAASHPLSSTTSFNVPTKLQGLNKETIHTIATLVSSLSKPPSSSLFPSPSPSPASYSQKNSTNSKNNTQEILTRITRFERGASLGHVSTEIGVVQFSSSTRAARILLPLPPSHPSSSSSSNSSCALRREGEECGFEILLPSLPFDMKKLTEEGAGGEGCERRKGIFRGGREEGECEHDDERGMDVFHESAWEFVGPDNNRYKWQMFVQCPILLLTSPTSPSPTPLARYKRAKLGIVSRTGRRAALEVFPEGVNVVDLVVVSFVGFMRRVGG